MNLTNQVERYLAPVCAELSPIHGLDEMFTRCFLNTLETTCQGQDSGDAFIITGDIQAMWLRDSTEQILHYLRFAPSCPELSNWITAVIHRQATLLTWDQMAGMVLRICPPQVRGYGNGNTSWIPSVMSFCWPGVFMRLPAARIS